MSELSQAIQEGGVDAVGGRGGDPRSTQTADCFHKSVMAASGNDYELLRLLEDINTEKIQQLHRKSSSPAGDGNKVQDAKEYGSLEKI